MVMSESIDVGYGTFAIQGDPTKLYENLAKAQAEFTPVPKMADGQVGMSRKFKYADYATIVRCVRPALSKYGITLLQPLHSHDGEAVTTTILAGHGASLRSSFYFKSDFSKKDKNGNVTDDPQEFGRSHTYYRRYQLQAMLGIEGDRDADDLPDVNESRKETSSYSEPERKPDPKPNAVSGATGKASGQQTSAPNAASDPKASGPAEQKSAPAVTKTEASVQPSETTTNGNGKAKNGKKPEGKPAPTQSPATPKTINDLLVSAMKQLGWEMPQLHEFYVQHIDPKDFDKAQNLTIEQRQAILAKMVEVHNVAPF